jgi:hypothetical protein
MPAARFHLLFLTLLALLLLGRSASADVPLVLNPSSATPPPRGARTFTPSGGLAPYAFSLAVNASEATLSTTGIYTAGSKGGVLDVVRVTDALGTMTEATVHVGAGVTITPAAPVVGPNGSVSLSAVGGSGTGYTWTLTANPSGGDVGVTGVYTAGNKPNTVDTIEVTDSLGNKRAVNVSVGAALAISPAGEQTSTRGTIAFSTTGGSGGLVWSLPSAPSGGAIDADNGVYVAGAIGNTSDTVRVQDAVGNSASVVVHVGPALTIAPKTRTAALGETIAFTASGGSGAGYTFTFDANESGGSLLPNGVFNAGTKSGVDIVRLTDSLGNVDTARISVNLTGVSTLPDGGTADLGTDHGNVRGLNLAGGGIDADCGCRTVGASSRGDWQNLLGVMTALVTASALGVARWRRGGRRQMADGD